MSVWFLCCSYYQLFYSFFVQEEEVDSLEAVLQKRDLDITEHIDQFLYESEPGPKDEGPVTSQADLPVAPPILEKEEAEEEVETYDSWTDLPDFVAQGTYTIDLVSQRRMLRHERSATENHLELPEATESTLMAHIDHSESEGA